jgi:hypothetical protein
MSVVEDWYAGAYSIIGSERKVIQLNNYYKKSEEGGEVNKSEGCL